MKNVKNLREMTLEENRAVQLEILMHTAKFCDEHNLRYFLAFGTLIGAVRHGGYIPWDDDIDIIMPRPDFNKLIELFQDQGHYRLLAPAHPDSWLYFIKIFDTRTIKIEKGVNYHDNYLGVDIDVFPLDGAPQDTDEYTSLRKQIHDKYKKYCTLRAGFSGSLKNRVLYLLYRLTSFRVKTILEDAVRLCEKYDFDRSDYCACYSRFTQGFRVPRENYSSAILMKFEDHDFRVPVGYDAALRARYGDYMQLPPPEKRITHHENKVYWRDQS